MGKIEAVIFDLDGVITDTAEFHYIAWKKLAEDLGISIDREFNETLKGVSRTESLERILELGNRQNDFSAEEKDELATKKNLHYVELLEQITPADLLPGIEYFLKQIRLAGLKIGMASASRNAFLVVDKLEIGHYFDYIVDAATVKNSKPDPEVFLRAAEALGVSPDKCVGIEDSVAGVEAINSAGMFSVGIGSWEILSQADFVISSTIFLAFDKLKKQYVLLEKNKDF
ncbi:beta-phosphoglucomutase [Bacillus sp. AFS017336]|uniref:beta-phosphoglucomutase n=1 Tax=Bacillus sp. AFS017336 TaxID=2033489 RepID=UPI000BF20B6F|nr:beta-phosphoglucomutase [Bacillus sp. AFS017336]PEL14294.1 beta-phosphoglucomutase [Bacillus sp. AFS017336]